MLELLEMKHSPYCIPIVRMLEGCRVPFTRREIPNWDRREIGRLTGGNYYQVPVLLDGTSVVHDQPDDPYRVARHADAKHCGGRFFPAAWGGVQEILIGVFEDRFEGVGFKLCDIHYVPSIRDDGERAMVVRHKERRFGVGCLEALIEPLDARFQSTPFLLGDQPLFADFALYGVLGNYTFNGWNALPPRLEGVTGWFDRMSRWSAAQ